MGQQLRPYQVEAREAIFARFATQRSTVLVLPTGMGKTTTFTAVAERWLAEGRGRVLVIADREELIQQAAERLRSFGLNVGIEMGGERVSTLFMPDVVVATIQTLGRASRRESFPPNAFGLVICDECHAAVAPQYLSVFSYFAGAKLLGVTATPDRKGMGQVFESIAYAVDIRDAIRDGYLCPIRQKSVHVEGLDFSQIKTTAGDLNEGELEAVLTEEENLHGVTRPLIELAGDRTTMVFTASVAHAHALATVMDRHLSAAGRPGQVVALDGTTDREERRAVLKRYAAGEIQYLLNCLDTATEVLTKRGWLGIDEIREGDITASIDPKTGDLEWTDVFHVVRRDRAPTERMVRIENQTLDIRVTEGHRMLTRAPGSTYWHIENAGTLPGRGGRYELPLAAHGLAEADAPAVSRATKPVAELSADECRFIGLWVADGHLPPAKAGVTIGQSARYVEANAEIRRILEACCFDYRVTERMTDRSPHAQLTYAIPKGTIGGQLARRGYAHLEEYLDKDFNPALFAMNEAQALAFVEGLWLGDGVKEAGRVHRGGQRRGWRICNTNKTLLDRVQRLAVTRGLGANLHGPKDNGPLSTKPIYHLHVRDRDAVTTNNADIATSGGNPARFEATWIPERVWCVSNRLGTIITRRNGHVVAMGQCALFIKGFDCPPISCVAMARPTKSRIMYTQAIGRGTRPLPGKADLLVLDFEGNAGRHSLVTALDVLDGNDDEDVRKRAKKYAANGDDLLAALDKASNAIAEEKRKKVLAAARYQAVNVDPFQVLGADPRPGRHSGMPPSPAQLEILDRKGITWQGIDYGQAESLIQAAHRRQREGLCTFKQAKLLAAKGLNPDLPFDEAGKAIDALKAAGWRPTPELLARYAPPAKEAA